ncbi:MAG: VOC family protein [Cytophagales bacterium]|nr:VOC family protein [Cytophagales bacterium]
MKNVNAVNWFEIPVKDMSRARKFYENLLGVEMMEMPPMGNDSEMVAFPWHQDAPFSAGALMRSEGYEPSATGTTVYFSCDELEVELGRVESNGGQVVFPKTSIGEHGFIAHIMDTEGNRVALHSLK